MRLYYVLNLPHSHPRPLHFSFSSPRLLSRALLAHPSPPACLSPPQRRSKLSNTGESGLVASGISSYELCRRSLKPVARHAACPPPACMKGDMNPLRRPGPELEWRPASDVDGGGGRWRRPVLAVQGGGQNGGKVSDDGGGVYGAGMWRGGAVGSRVGALNLV